MRLDLRGDKFRAKVVIEQTPSFVAGRKFWCFEGKTAQLYDSSLGLGRLT